MIVVTGAAGFIGSCMVARLNQDGYRDLVVVDDFSNEEKNLNLDTKVFREKVDRKDLFSWLEREHKWVQMILHLGARTNTAEFDKNVLDALNPEYSKKVWKACVQYGLPLIYASSAATYGDGSRGYSDDHAGIPGLKPLNPYGWSKQEFDVWVLEQKEMPWFWAGFKFFNVYGPNEYHKGRMASVILHAYKQIRESGTLRLFRSHHPDFKDGEQKRDFVYVKDVTDILSWFMQHRKDSGIYNLGSGEARTFLDLGRGVFQALGNSPKIEFVDTPKDIRDKYQYYTCADMSKVRKAGYTAEFTTLEKGIEEYVETFLLHQKYW